MIRDTVLSPSAKVVYLELALWVFDGTTCWVGQRAIAERVGLSRNTVAKAIDELIERGHVELIEQAKGRRQCYVLTSELFGAPKADSPICDECGRRLPKLKDACVACARDKAKLEAWQAAKLELPDGAADVDIAARVLANKTVKTHRRAARELERLEQREAEWSVA